MQIEQGRGGGLGEFLVLNVINAAGLFVQYLEHAHLLVQVLAGIAVVAMNGIKVVQYFDQRSRKRSDKNE